MSRLRVNIAAYPGTMAGELEVSLSSLVRCPSSTDQSLTSSKQKRSEA